MEDRTSLELLFQKIETYLNTSLELYKLKLVSKSASIFSEAISYFIFMLLFLFAVLFCAVGLAIWTGELLGTMYYGFVIVGLLFFVISMLAYKFRYQWMNQALNETIIITLLNNDEDAKAESAPTSVQ